MPTAKPKSKQELKALLERAKLEIDKMSKRVDSASDEELAEIRGTAIPMASWFDANAGCH
jgi:hypothetical protein